MSTKIKYTDEPLGKLRVVPDFLPAPEDLVFREEGIKDMAKWRSEHEADLKKFQDQMAELRGAGRDANQARPVRTPTQQELTCFPATQ